MYPEYTGSALAAILTYGQPWAGRDQQESPDEPEPTEWVLVVAPRLGTISPWASKATDIVHNCGIPIHRVERVTEVHLELEEGTELSGQERDACAAMLHDRMTETVLPTREAAADLFTEQDAQQTVQAAIAEGTLAENETFASDMDDLGEAGIMARSSTNPTAPDLQLHMLPAYVIDHGRHRVRGHGFTINTCNLRPRSQWCAG